MMTDDDIGLLGRLTAYEELLTFLIARDFVGRDDVEARAVAQSIVDAPRELAAGIMDADDLQSVQSAAQTMQAKLLNHALVMAERWREMRQEG